MVYVSCLTLFIHCLNQDFRLKDYETVAKSDNAS